MTSPLGKTQRPVSFCAAGDICAIAKLSHAATGDTLSAKDDPLIMRPWEMPEPLLPVAVVAHAKADEDKLSQGLQRLAAEDPTLRLENNPETHQLVLWTMERRTLTCCWTAFAPGTASPSTRSTCACRCAKRSPARRGVTAAT